jgi:hypothetical protein
MSKSSVQDRDLARTVFFPTPEAAERFKGRDAVEARFRQVSDGIRNANRVGPRFQRLTPEDRCVQLLSQVTAIVTFHLRNAVNVANQ